MKQNISIKLLRFGAGISLVCILLLGPVQAHDGFSNENQSGIFSSTTLHAFQPGEVLTYDVSWSNVMSAGTAVMAVKDKTLSDGTHVLAFLLMGNSAGVVNKVVHVNETLESIFDPALMQSISYTLTENVGRKKRHKSLDFNHIQNSVVARLNEDPAETVSISPGTRDGLASLYYLRTRNDFIVGRTFDLDVHDSGKNWTVEVNTLGREQVKTPAGEFATIKVKTRPLCEGVYQNSGEVLLWLTDDDRKVPVVMKSATKIGSIVFTLKEMKTKA